LLVVQVVLLLPEHVHAGLWSSSSSAHVHLSVRSLNRFIVYLQAIPQLTCCKWRATAVRISSSSSAKRTALSILLLRMYVRALRHSIMIRVRPVCCRVGEFAVRPPLPQVHQSRLVSDLRL
jgi:hypothetical protein